MRLRAAGVVLGCGLGAVVASWPLAALSGSVYASDPMAIDVSTAVWYGARFGADPLGSGEAPMLLWPHGQPLRLQVWNRGVHLLQLPLYRWFHPIQAYNVSVVLLGALNGVGGYVLGRFAGGSAAAGLAGAAALLFCPFAWSELVRGRAEQGLLVWVALAVAGMLALRRDPSPKHLGILTGLAWAAAGLFYWFYGYFLLLIAGAVGVGAAARRDRVALRRLGEAAGVAALVAAPAAVPLLAAMAEPGSAWQQATSAEVEALAHSLRQQSSLGLAEVLCWPAFRPPHLGHVLPLAALAAAMVGGALAVVRRREWLLAGLAAGGILLAMGPVLLWRVGEPAALPGGGGGGLGLPLQAVTAVLPGFGRLWWPYRFLSVAWVGLAGCAAVLVGQTRQRWAVAAGVAGLLLLELRIAQRAIPDGLVWDSPRAFGVPSFFVELAGRRSASEQGEPLLHLPFRGPGSASLHWQVYHHHPTSAGTGDTEDHLLPAGYLAWIRDQPGLSALQALARQPPQGGRGGAVRLPAPAALRAELAGLGYAHAVLILGAPGASVPLYAGVFGEEPGYYDGVIAVWSLRPREE